MQNSNVEIVTLSEPVTTWQSKVDDIEEPFSMIYDADEWGNPPLAQMNRFDTRMVLNEADRLMECNGRLSALDVGTGPGRIAMKLAQRDGARVTALDATRGYLELVAKTAQRIRLDPDSLTLVEAPIEEFTYEEGLGGPYDLITAIFGVLNHVENWQETLQAFYDNLNPGGSFVSSIYGTNEARVYRMRSNNELPYKPSLVQTRVDGGIRLGEGEEVLPAKFPSIREFRQALEEIGFEVEVIQGFLDFAACFPSETTDENIAEYKALIQAECPDLFERIESLQDPRVILIEVVEFEREYALEPNNLGDFAYVGFVARKRKL